MHIIGFLGEAGTGKDEAGKLLVQQHGLYSLAFADPLKVFCMWMFGWSADQLWGPSALRNLEDLRYPFLRCPKCGYRDLYLVVTGECPACRTVTPEATWHGHLSPRYGLQELGTEWARGLNKDCHTNFGVKRSNLVLQAGTDADPLASVIPAKVLRDRMDTRNYLGVNPQGVYISDCRFQNEVEAIRAVGGRVYRIVRDVTIDVTSTGIPNHDSEVEQRAIRDADLDGVIENNGTLDDLAVAVHKHVIAPQPS